MTEFSQVSCIGKPQPRSWDDFERGCMGTYRGGHDTPETVEAFTHGMGTVFNLLRAEFPPAELCRAAPDLLAACEAALAWMSNVNTHEPQDVYKMLINALTKAGCDKVELDRMALSLLAAAVAVGKE